MFSDLQQLWSPKESLPQDLLSTTQTSRSRWSA